MSGHCAAQETRLLMTSLSPGGSTNSVFFNQWSQKLADQSGGAVKIDVRDGTTLANFGNVYERVQDDVVQIGWAIHQVVAGKFPLSEVAGLPFVEGGFSRASLALYRLAQTGLLNNEYKDVVPLVFSVFGPSQLHFARQPRSIDDLNGLKIGVAGRAPSQLVTALGADIHATGRFLRSAAAPNSRWRDYVVVGVRALQAAGSYDLPCRDLVGTGHQHVLHG
jgi:TRAP-type C4-dicarboxylate transport system substrate-binding protein